jgi:sugar (pentulose or hexulose) kinase
LPDVLPNDQRVGKLSATAAAELGLPAGLPVVMSPYDIASTAIGVGAVSDGQACSILGTTLCTEVVMNHINLEGEPSGLTIPFGPPGLYLRSFPTLAGSEVIHWTVRQLGLSSAREILAFVPADRWIKYRKPPNYEKTPLDVVCRSCLFLGRLERCPSLVPRGSRKGLQRNRNQGYLP